MDYIYNYNKMISDSLNLYLIPDIITMIIELAEDLICVLLHIEHDGKHCRFICRNMKTNMKFAVYTEYIYFYQSLSEGINLTCWFDEGFETIINRLIELQTLLIWNNIYYCCCNGPCLLKSDDLFCQWLNEHHNKHQLLNQDDDFDFWCDPFEYYNGIDILNRNTTNSPIEELD